MSAQSAGVHLVGASTPVRRPDTSSRPIMTKRAWWLVLLNVLVPGSAQVLAGSRRLGRFALGSTLLLWTLTVVAVVLYIVSPAAIYTVFTTSWALLAAQVFLAFYAVLWVVLAFDTLRLARLFTTAPPVRVLVAFFAVVLLFATAGTATYGVVVVNSARTALDQVFTGGNYADPVNGRYNVLMLGGDAGADRTGLRPDSISVVSIDADTGATTIIGVPRNLQKVQFVKDSPLWGPFPTGYDCGNDCLVSYLYTYGEEHPDLYPDAVSNGSTPGIEAMRDAIAGVTGLKLQYYVLIDMKGFAKLINALGGITIDVKERLPIEGGEDANGQPTDVAAWIEPGVQKMRGSVALWYARSRHGTSDYDRMKRQRDVQEAILTQFSPANVLTKFQSIAEAGSQIVETDIPQVMLGHFVELAGKAREKKLTRLELSPPAVDMVQPNFDEVHALVKKAVKKKKS